MTKKKKWMQEAVNPKEKGELHRKMGIPEDEEIPTEKLEKKKKQLQEKGKGDKKLSDADRETLSQIQFALNARKSKKKSNVLVELQKIADSLDQEGFDKLASDIDTVIISLSEKLDS